MNYVWRSWQTLGNWCAGWINWLVGKEHDHEKRIAALEAWRQEIDGRLKAIASHVGADVERLKAAEDAAGKVTKL